MTRRMLIDATHPEETRVVVASGNRLEETDYDTAHKAQLKGNIYLAKVTRVEPSLQAAFVDYGGNRHGFLAFSEIHPDYYRIPVEDREDLVDDENGDETEGDDGTSSVEEVGGDDDEIAEVSRRRPRLRRHYKIQEVIKRRQILLVQVVKEERGNKGAALTTYLSLAGRYCVLMPNTSRGGGISRKITNAADRKRLKSIISEIKTPPGMAVILRTAGSERSKAEIKRDYEYLMRLWDDIRAKTLESTAPALINEEANLIKRSIRDLYAKDIDEILVAGEDAYKTARAFMSDLIPSHAKKVKRYKDKEDIPLLQRYQMEGQLAAIHDPVVQLRSGGYIVMHQTEALVAIDVNSGRSTRERNIEETALKTNSEAAEEVARQLRLRDLAGLIVIDFIDMEDQRNNHQVERRLKEAMRRDRARIQLGRISPFGLLEMSRQRLRPSLQEATSQICVHCGGTGFILSTETQALRVLRAIEEEGMRRRALEVSVRIPSAVALYILNNKREAMAEIEARYDFKIQIETDDEHIGPSGFELTRTQMREGRSDEEEEERSEEAADGEKKRKRKRGRRRKRSEAADDEVLEQSVETVEEEAGDTESEEADRDAEAEGDGERTRRRRRRGRRGGRRARRDNGGEAASVETDAVAETGDAPEAATAEDAVAADAEGAAAEAAESSDAVTEETSDAEAAEAKKPSRRRTRRPKKAEAAEAEATAEKPKRTRQRRKPKAEKEPAAEAGPDEAAAETVAAAEEAAPGPVETVAESPQSAPSDDAGQTEPAPLEEAVMESPAPDVKPEVPAEAEPMVQIPVAEQPEPMPQLAAAEPAPMLTAPEPTEELAPSPEPAEEERPKRRGWWKRR